MWNKKIIKILRSLGFKFILADASIFIHPCSIIIALYIDNILILVKNLKEVEQVKNNIKKTHIIKNLEAVFKILEIHITHKIDRFIKIDQDHYIQQVLVKFDMENLKPTPVPLSPSLNLEN